MFPDNQDEKVIDILYWQKNLFPLIGNSPLILGDVYRLIDRPFAHNSLMAI